MVRQHQYLAIEDFFIAAFQASTSLSANQDQYHVFNLDRLLYGSSFEKPSQQKAKSSTYAQNKKQHNNVVMLEKNQDLVFNDKNL